MRLGWIPLTALFGVCAMASTAQAQQGASALTAPRPARSSPPASPTVPLTPPERPRADDSSADEFRHPRASEDDSNADAVHAAPVGPRIEIGYALYRLSDGETSGRVHAGSFGGYFHTGSLRLGGRAELGKRADSLGVDDVLVRAMAVVGYQYRRSRWLPYLVGVASYGWLIEQGTGSPRTASLPGGGLELGLDLRLGAVFLGVSAGWTRVRLRGEFQDLWLLRVRAGV